MTWNASWWFRFIPTASISGLFADARFRIVCLPTDLGVFLDEDEELDRSTLAKLNNCTTDGYITPVFDGVKGYDFMDDAQG